MPIMQKEACLPGVISSSLQQDTSGFYICYHPPFPLHSLFFFWPFYIYSRSFLIPSWSFLIQCWFFCLLQWSNNTQEKRRTLRANQDTIKAPYEILKSGVTS